MKFAIFGKKKADKAAVQDMEERLEEIILEEAEVAAGQIGRAEPKATSALDAYYDDRHLLWRNMGWLAVLNVGWSVCFTVVNPLMTLHMNSPQVGMGESMIGTIFSINNWLVSLLVMYFSWKSDHTVSRWGRRIPFLWISAPMIILTVFLFPFFTSKWILVGIMVVQLLFMDMKNSTIALLPIDCVPRHLLARANSIQAIVLGLVGFFALRYGMKLSDYNERLPYFIGGGLMLITTIFSGLFIKEPPIQNPTTEAFKPWSALKIGFRDRRLIVLMLGVAMVNSFTYILWAWIWLFAKNVLHLSRTDMGSAMSWSSLIGMALAFPYAWLIDRVSPYKLLTFYMALLTAVCCSVFFAHNSNGLAMVWILSTCSSGLMSIGIMMLLKIIPHAEVGSFTSSAAFINCLYIGSIVFVSGHLIEAFGHNYYLAFVIGLVLSFIGFGIILFYRRLIGGSSVSIESLSSLSAKSAPNAETAAIG